MIEWLDIDFLIQKFFKEHPQYIREDVESEDDYTDEEWEPDPNYYTDDDDDL